MGYFPFYINIEGKRCLVAGGGKVALRKVKDLLPFGPLFRVIAPDILPELCDLAEAAEAGGRIAIERRKCCAEDAGEADFVIAAVDDEALQRNLFEYCSQKGIPINSVDRKEFCSFIFPSLITEGPVTVGISTGGASPAVAQYLKKRFAEVLPEGIGALTLELGQLRDCVRERIPRSQKLRSQVFHQLAEEGIKLMEQGRRLTQEHSLEIIEETVRTIAEGEILEEEKQGMEKDYE